MKEWRRWYIRALEIKQYRKITNVYYTRWGIKSIVEAVPFRKTMVRENILLLHIAERIVDPKWWWQPYFSGFFNQFLANSDVEAAPMSDPFLWFDGEIIISVAMIKSKKCFHILLFKIVHKKSQQKHTYCNAFYSTQPKNCQQNVYQWTKPIIV